MFMADSIASCNGVFIMFSMLNTIKIYENIYCQNQTIQHSHQAKKNRPKRLEKVEFPAVNQ